MSEEKITLKEKYKELTGRDVVISGKHQLCPDYVFNLTDHRCEKDCLVCWSREYKGESVKGELVPDTNETKDNINHPAHYEGKFECIDAMVEQFGVDAVSDFCLCNSFKYLWRCMKKHEDPTEDIKKADWYLKKWIELQG